MADLVGLFVPIASMGFLLGIFWLIMKFLADRQRLNAGLDTGYQQLAEEALRGQAALAEQTKQLAERLSEMERLLREV